jgi:hypothetical protein
VRVFALVLILFLTAAPASASLNRTIDPTLVGSHGSITESPVGSFPFNAISLRLVGRFGALRSGYGVTAFFPQITCACDPASRVFMFGGEIFMGYSPGGYWAMRPYFEARAHVERLEVGAVKKIFAGAGPRLGVLVPIDEYFFVDAGMSIDVVGAEGIRGGIGIGLPIPLSHL